MQHFLTRVFDSRGGPRGRDSQFVAARSEFGFFRRIPHLRDDIPKFCVGSREGQRALGLDFEYGSGTVGVDSFDDDIIERMVCCALLEFDGADRRA
jgi:hypothetical protein